jgi:putative flippase GtrA
MTSAFTRQLAKSVLGHRLARFVVVGGSSAMLLFLLVYVAQRFLGLAAFHATIAGYLLLVTPTYAVQRAWTFRSGAAHLQAFPRYLATQTVAGLLTAIATAAFAAWVAAEPVWLSSMFAAACGGIVSFALGALWVFRGGPPASIGPGTQWNISATALATVSTAFFIVLVVQLPIALLANAGHDDAWFWHHGEAVASMKWFGGYSQYTLMKGPGYPFFLALNGWLGTPVSMAQALLYSAACGLLAVALYRVSGRLWLASASFVAMQWHPMALSWDRVVRDNIYAAQSILVVACAMQLLFVARAPRARLAWAAATGIALGWFWITREDGIWLLPGLAVLFLGRLVQPGREGVRAIARDGLVAIVGFACVLAGLASLNLLAYGRFETVDFRGAAYGNAVRALQQVRVGEPVPYVPVPEKVRREVYAVSPGFASLAPYFEGTGRAWSQPGCDVYPHSCGDYAGGWFIWTFRDAAASIGAYRSPAEAARFYRQVTDDIRSACGDGRLTCQRSALGFMPAVTPGQWSTLPRRMREAVALLLWRDVAFPERASHGHAVRQERMWRFLGQPRAMPSTAGTAVLAGWFRSPDGAWLQLRCDGAEGSAHQIPRHGSPDLVRRFHDPSAGQSRFELPAPTGQCALEVSSGKHAGAHFELPEDKALPATVRLGDGELYLERLETAATLSPPPPAAALAARAAIGRIYAGASTWLASAGALAVVLASVLAIRRRRADPLLVLAVSAWCLVAGRLAVLVLVDVSSFPAINVQYMQPAFPLLVLASIASLAALFPRRRGADPREAGGAVRP